MSKKVLIISNTPKLTELLQRGLSDDYKVSIQNITKRLKEELKEKIEEEKPDLIILDIIMPNLDGIGTCLTLRQFTQVSIIMLSVWATKENQIRGLNLGSDSYLTKPFGISELKTRIEETLERCAK